MINESRFPDASDTLVVFRNYPLGSASWTWYVCKVIGFREGSEVFAHSFLLLGFLTSLFALAKKKTSVVMAVIVSLILLAGDQYLDNNLFSLHVDTLISIMSLASFSIVLFYRENGRRAAAFSSPVLMYLASVKASAFLFVTAICVYVLFDTRGAKEKLKNLLIMYLPPVLMVLMWSIRTKIVFASVRGDGNNAGMSTHEFSMERFLNVWNSRTPAENKEIVRNFIATLFSPGNKMLYVFAAALLILLIAAVKHIKIPQFGRIFAFMTCLYLTFFFGLMLIYLFSMRTDEAVRLSAFYRYKLTMDFFVIGVATVQAVRFNERAKNEITGIMGIAVLIAVSVFHMSALSTMILPKTRYDTDVAKEQFKEMCEINDVPAGKDTKYLIYYSGFDSEYLKGYMYYVSRYYLWSSKVMLCSKESVGNISNDSLSVFDCIIVVEKDEVITKWLDDHDTGNIRIIYAEG